MREGDWVYHGGVCVCVCVCVCGVGEGGRVTGVTWRWRSIMKPALHNEAQAYAPRCRGTCRPAEPQPPVELR